MVGGFQPAFLKYKCLKLEIKGVFSRSFCCYGNLLCHENGNVNNVIKSGYNDPSRSKTSKML